MTTTPTTTPTPVAHNPVTQSEAYSVQVNAKATDIHVLHLPYLGRYAIQVGDLAYIHVDRDGLKTLAEQIGQVL